MNIIMKINGKFGEKVEVKLELRRLFHSYL